MTPHAFYKGCLKDMRTHLGESKAFCAYCGRPFTTNGDEYCSDRCAEDHDTVQKGGTTLPEHERCDCAPRPGEGLAGHEQGCPRYVPHPEDYSLENEA
jgi:predicted amidophosphoribosyltransferase